LPGIDHLELIELRADGDKYLTDGERKVSSIVVPADEVDNWTEEVRGIVD